MPGNVKNDQLLEQIRLMQSQLELLRAQNEQLTNKLKSKTPELKPLKHLQYNPSVLTPDQRHQIDYHREQCSRFNGEIQRTTAYLSRLNKARDKHQIKLLEIQQLAMVEVEL